jgi:hypothetical protein
MNIEDLESQFQDDEFDLSLMSREEALHVIKRHEELVKGRVIVPEGWVGWELEFFLGRCVNVDVVVVAVSADGAKRLRSTTIIHSEPPDSLQDEIQKFQIEAASFGPQSYPFDDSFAHLPLAVLPGGLIDQIKRDLLDPALDVYVDALQRLDDFDPTNDIELDIQYLGRREYDLADLNEIDDPASPFKGYMGFTGGFQEAGIYLASDLECPPRVAEIELCRDPEDTIVTLILEDHTRCSLDRQHASFFNYLKHLEMASIIVRCKDRVPEASLVSVALAKT